MIPALAPFVTLESACFQIHGRPFFAMEELHRLVLSLEFFLSSPFLPSIEYVRVEYRSREKPCFGFSDGTKWSVASCFNFAEFFVYLCTWVSFSKTVWRFDTRLLLSRYFGDSKNIFAFVHCGQLFNFLNTRVTPCGRPLILFHSLHFT